MKNRRWAPLLAILLAVAPIVPASAEQCVILLHGLARTEHSMKKLAQALQEAGYITVNQRYPSSKFPIETLAKTAVGAALKRCPPQAKIHFVTHSMGGILVRQYLHTDTLANLGRVVMLGPPNKGSEVVDKLHWVPGFKLFNGPAGTQLGTGELSVPNKLGPANFKLGIIAGTYSINLILSAMLPGRDDGKVSVENTKLKGMDDHIALPVTHPLMMNNAEVIEQVIYFLEHGVFRQEPASGAGVG